MFPGNVYIIKFFGIIWKHLGLFQQLCSVSGGIIISIELQRNMRKQRNQFYKLH